VISIFEAKLDKFFTETKTGSVEIINIRTEIKVNTNSKSTVCY